MMILIQESGVDPESGREPMSQADAAYYRRRAREERERAEQATLANAAAIHKKLAERYEVLAEREELSASVASTQQRHPNGRPSV